ncbi:hypothetical protein CBL_08482 [Carabus blaptoides fortunei]
MRLVNADNADPDLDVQDYVPEAGDNPQNLYNEEIACKRALWPTTTEMTVRMTYTERSRYNERLDQINGFTDDGQNRNQDIADHALKWNLFEVNWAKVIALYDVPHLFIAEPLRKKHIVCSIQDEVVTSNWQHIEAAYAIDQQEVDYLRPCPKLTDRHIKLDHCTDKMKVKYCTQVLSQRVTTMINYLAKKNDICIYAKQTAQIVLFLDQLFDSLNSSSRNGTGGKSLT